MTTPTNPTLDLGPVSSLLGYWKGFGKDVAFMPGGQKIESDYLEEMTVTAVPVMRVTRTMFIHAATYVTRLVHPKTLEPLHHEVGYWVWVPESRIALRTIALGRALGVVATSPAPAGDGASSPFRFQFKAGLAGTPSGIATAVIGTGVPSMEEFECAVEVEGNKFSYDQVTRVRFGPGPLLDHTDAAILARQP